MHIISLLLQYKANINAITPKGIRRAFFGE